MKYRRIVLFGALAAVVAVASAPIAGQAPRAAASTAAPTWTPLRTAWGDPDLQGIWRGRYRVNFERPPELEGREFLTDAQVAELERKADARNELRLQGKQENRGEGNQPNYNSIIGYSPDRARYAKRTSAIIDPPDGRLPPWTLEQVKRYEAREAATLGRGEADWTVDRPTSERCIPVVPAPVLGFWGMTLAGRSSGAAQTAETLNQGEGFSNSTSGGGPYRIIQAPGYVVILEEESGLGGGPSGSRIIPLDGRPHLGPKFRQWLGDALGHWDGNTLAVETTNIKYPYPIITSHGPTYPADGETLRFIERYTRVGADTIEYRYTVDDATVYTRPYTVLHELTREDNYKISALACHEGHDDMPSALASGRVDEETALDNANETKVQREPRLKQLKEEAIKAAEQKKNR